MWSFYVISRSVCYMEVIRSMIPCHPQVSEFQERLSLIGYTDKLRWAVYDPDTHSIRAPNDCVASDTEDLNSHVGYEFSPYWKPQHGTELDRCRNIGGWWKTRERCRAEAPLAPRRRHLLVSEASPDLPPGGFFDCTIEVSAVCLTRARFQRVVSRC